jgi:hypothetical protein
MKKILVALMAVMMTMGLMAQCPQQKTCASQQAGQCQVKKECVKRNCVYSPETRAMMQVDRLSRVIKDLTGTEREQLLAFYKAHYTKCEKRKETANPMTKEECRNECNAELRKVLGDDRYIQYLETMKVNKMDCDMRACGPRGEKPCMKGEKPCVKGEKPATCQKPCSSTCPKK